MLETDMELVETTTCCSKGSFCLLTPYEKNFYANFNVISVKVTTYFTLQIELNKWMPVIDWWNTPLESRPVNMYCRFNLPLKCSWSSKDEPPNTPEVRGHNPTSVLYLQTQSCMMCRVFSFKLFSSEAHPDVSQSGRTKMWSALSITISDTRHLHRQIPVQHSCVTSLCLYHQRAAGRWDPVEVRTRRPSRLVPI